MSKKYVDNDYTLNIFAKNIEDNTSIRQVAGSGQAIDGRTYANSVNTSNKKSHTLYATASFHEAFGQYGSGYRNTGTNRSSRLFGKAIHVSGNTAAVSINANSTNNAHNDNWTGVMMIDSGSSGWIGRHHLRIPLNLMATASTGDPHSEDFANSFSYDRKYGRTVAMTHRSMDTGGGTSPGNGCVYIFTSQSTAPYGWSHEQTITTASLPSSIMDHWGSTNADGSGVYWGQGWQRWCSTVRVDGEWMTIGSLERLGVPASEWGNPTRAAHYAASKRVSHGVVLFRSSSSGWIYNRFLDGYDNDYPNASNSDYAIDCNHQHDLREGTCVFASAGGWGTGYLTQNGGRIKIWKLKEDGNTWRNDGFHDLHTLGLLDNIWPTIGGDSAVPGTDQSDTNGFPTSGWTGGDSSVSDRIFPEFAAYTSFGRQGVAASGSYIVATAAGRDVRGNLESGGTGVWERISNKIFIIKSSSAGWNLQAKFSSPWAGAQGPQGTFVVNDRFGQYGMAISGDIIAVKSLHFQDDHGGTTNRIGRVYTYRRNFESDEWSLDAIIENPYRDLDQINTPYTGRVGFAGEADSDPGGTNVQEETIGLGGDEASGGSEHLIIPWYRLVDNDDLEEQYGAIYILSGSNHYRDTDPEFEDVPTNHAPFIKAVNGPMNIRLQKGSSKPYFVDLGDTES